MQSKDQEEGCGSSDGSIPCPSMWGPCTKGKVSAKPGALGVSSTALKTSSALQPNQSFTF